MWIIFIVGLFLPRFVAAIAYFFSEWFTGVFQTWYWPLLGFLFMPYTMLWYSVVANWYSGAWATWHIIVLVIAVLMDLSSNAKSRG